jgi:hypothetical protein
LNARGYSLELAYAAPRTSEAVRILFPAHRRKMWSGGEVQAWLDEHQGIAPPKPSAKGSLERYRKWQAERTQASEDGADCSCPTGDGSLRHPCAVHPPGEKDGGHGSDQAPPQSPPQNRTEALHG